MIYELVKREDRWDLYNPEGHKVASTLEGCKSKLSIKNCEAIERGYDLDELVNEEISKFDQEARIVYRRQLQESLANMFSKALYLMDLKLKTRSEELFRSMALRYRHDFGLLNENEQKGTLIVMSQIWEEVVGRGFFRGQTEWEVEFDKLKLDENGCLILKKV